MRHPSYGNQRREVTKADKMKLHHHTPIHGKLVIADASRRVHHGRRCGSRRPCVITPTRGQVLRDVIILGDVIGSAADLLACVTVTTSHFELQLNSFFMRRKQQPATVESR